MCIYIDIEKDLDLDINIDSNRTQVGCGRHDAARSCRSVGVGSRVGSEASPNVGDGMGRMGVVRGHYHKP